MKFLIKPYEWQLKAIKLSTMTDNLALFAEMGVGKTGAVINILRLLYGKSNRVRRTLILTPVVTIYNWKNEFNLHSRVPQEDVYTITKTGKVRIRQVKEAMLSFDRTRLDGDCVIILNYEATLNKELVGLIEEWKPEVLICDESHMVKTHNSKRTKAVIHISDIVRQQKGNVYIMTGTPILNSPQDIFSQYRILDGGTTFGDNFYIFRQMYFEDVNSGWSDKPAHFAKYEARADMYKELNSKIYSKAIRVLKNECLDLPPLVKEVRNIPLSTEQSKLYKEMKRDFITFVEDKMKEGMSKAVVATVAVTKALRLMQITTGFVKTEEGEEINLKKNPRLEYVEELLKEIAPDHKVILWCVFKRNYVQLAQVCKKLKLKHTFLTGEQTLEQKKEAMDEFNTDPKCRVIIANRRAGGTGINLIAASYSIVYSRNFSLGDEKQSEARNYRGGSQIHERIVKIDLCTKDTIDEYVLDSLGKKHRISADIIDAVRKY